jgi:hypothetical protein
MTFPAESKRWNQIWRKYSVMPIAVGDVGLVLYVAIRLSYVI